MGQCLCRFFGPTIQPTWCHLPDARIVAHDHRGPEKIYFKAKNCRACLRIHESMCAGLSFHDWEAEQFVASFDVCLGHWLGEINMKKLTGSAEPLGNRRKHVNKLSN